MVVLPQLDPSREVSLLATGAPALPVRLIGRQARTTVGRYPLNTDYRKEGIHMITRGVLLSAALVLLAPFALLAGATDNCS